MEPEPRIGPGSRREVGFANALVLRAIELGMGGVRPNLFATLARHRRLFRRWLWFAGALMPGGRLPRDETELVILRVADNTGSAYEWDHHVRLGRRAGLSPTEIERVRTGPSDPRWTPRRRLLLRAADELHAQRRIGDELWAELAAVLDEVELIELCFLIGHYEMLASTIASLRIQRDSLPSGGG